VLLAEAGVEQNAERERLTAFRSEAFYYLRLVVFGDSAGGFWEIGD
jgi:hypothetical protein